VHLNYDLSGVIDLHIHSPQTFNRAFWTKYRLPRPQNQLGAKIVSAPKSLYLQTAGPPIPISALTPVLPGVDGLA
jgi:hypothetical protein